MWIIFWGVGDHFRVLKVLGGTGTFRGWVGPGPGPAREGIESYSAQEGIDSKGNIIDIYYPI